MPGSAITTVIPAFNEGDRLFTFLQDWASAGASQEAVRVTALVVDDGSREQASIRQREAVEAAAAFLKRAGARHDVRYLRADRNRGKGASIRWGWSQADPGADWLGFIDADGALPAREYWRLAVGLPGTPADVVCGSRIKMAGRTIERSFFRHVQGRVFATGVEELFHLGFYDTQCGLKFFRASRLRPLLPVLQEERWLLDVEVLARLQETGARFMEVPVDCNQHGASSLVFGVDPAKMLVRLVRLRRRLRARGGNAS
jgi:dolichyl-phosphate beta-glucosyltransferase